MNKLKSEEEFEKQREREYQKMKDRAKSFCDLLVQFEREFSVETNGWGDGIAVFVTFRADNGKVTAIFYEAGAVTFTIDEYKEGKHD